MKPRSMRNILALALPATILAVGVHGSSAQARSNHSTPAARAAETARATISCASVGGWCADVERAAMTRLAGHVAAPTPYVRTSCDTVGGWCADAERAALKRLHQPNATTSVRVSWRVAGQRGARRV